MAIFWILIRFLQIISLALNLLKELKVIILITFIKLLIKQSWSVIGVVRVKSFIQCLQSYCYLCSLRIVLKSETSISLVFESFNSRVYQYNFN